jgi:endoglucanase
MKKYTLFSLLVLSMLCPRTFAQVNGTGSITSGGIMRTFAYHLPAASPACNLPVLLAFHGDGGTGAGFQSYAGFDALANTNNFIVVYPDAKLVGGSLQFNKYADAAPGFGTAGDPSFGTSPDPNAPDDVQFTSDLIDYLYTTYNINRNRVYATGHSGGGFMSYFLGVALTNKIAAIAPVAASLWINSAYSTNRFSTANYVQVPVLHIHSKGDGTVTPPIVPYPKTPAYVWPLTQFSGSTCSNWNTYTTTAINTNADMLTFCATGKEVRLIVTKDATHGWPTAVSAPQQIWDFVKNFSITTNPATVCNNTAPVVDNHIKIDQFGYIPDAKKIAVISNPQTGYNNNQPFTPSTTYQIRRVSDDVSVLSGTPTAWNAGATHTQSGDKVWWFDFSSLCTVGQYYVYDVGNNVRSYTFEIRGDVYRNVLKQATRTFFYQRCGMAKSTPHAQSPWTDGVCHRGTQQDDDCRLVSNTNVSTSKNLQGGWHDAGDYNKYVPFTFTTLTNMCLAYQENPSGMDRRLWDSRIGQWDS